MHTNSYHLFLKDISKGTGLKCREGAEMWRTLPDEERALYTSKAADVRQQSRLDRQQLLKKIQCDIDKLQDTGLDIALIFVDTKCEKPGTKIYGKGLLKNVLTNCQPLLGAIGRAYATPGIEADSDRRMDISLLRGRVREHLNAAANSSGDYGRAFPYRSIRNGKVVAVGWPASVKLKDISSMSRQDLTALLRSRITLKQCEEATGNKHVDAEVVDLGHPSLEVLHLATQAGTLAVEWHNRTDVAVDMKMDVAVDLKTDVAVDLKHAVIEEISGLLVLNHSTAQADVIDLPQSQPSKKQKTDKKNVVDLPLSQPSRKQKTDKKARKTWTSMEEQTIQTYFGDFIAKGETVPDRFYKEMLSFFEGRTYDMLKAKITRMMRQSRK